MEIKPKRDWKIKEKLEIFIVKFLGSGLYFFVVIFGLMSIFRLGINAETSIVYGLCVMFLGFFIRPILKRKFGLYGYDPKKMSEQESEARAELGEAEYGSLGRFIGGFLGLVERYRILRTNPNLARRIRANSENFEAMRETIGEAVIPHYRTGKKIRMASSPVAMFWVAIIKLQERQKKSN